MNNQASYATRFTDRVVTLLGGMEMAEEFFRLHPGHERRMRQASLYHRLTSTTGAYKGALIFFTLSLRPMLVADREAAIGR